MDTVDRDKNESSARFPVNLFCSLMLLSFIPFLYTLVRTNLIANGPVTDGLGIAGHMEWFDLINETVQAFLIVPLFALLNQCMQDRERLKERIFQLFVVVNVIYLAFSAFIFLHCSDIVAAMVPERLDEVTGYLKLETIGFVIANAVCFVNVLFVVLEKPFYIYAMVVLRTVFTIIGDLFLIPRFGVNGVAYSNIVVNVVCVILCLTAVFREKLIAVSFQFDKSFVKDYLFIGAFSGCQILLDNIIYSAIVCKMVNGVAEQGNYWAANNIIWGLMLIPISALGEIIKKDCRGKLSRAKMRNYHIVIILTFLAWLCLIPMLNPFLKNVMGIENFGTIKHIIVVLIPFYLAYNYTVLFDNLLIGYGKTYYCFATSVVVNLVYYPILYGCVLKGIFAPDITFICMMFGFGMVIHLGCSVVCFVVQYKIENKVSVFGKGN
ncbi:sodium transporter [bacterium 1XD21-13]|nr:sodium transporter [bacterium 1XD21-13]